MRFCARLLLVLFLLASPMMAQAETAKAVPVSHEQVQLSFAPLVKSAAPAVVNIYTRKVVRQRAFSPFADDPFFQYFFGGAMPQGPSRQRLENSLGSGVIVRGDGVIVTSNHVTEGADEITVVLADRREFEAKVALTDAHADLAVLRIDTKGEVLPFLQLKDSDEAEVGDMVLAIGDPFGVGQTVTSGIISALARTTTDINDLNYFIQTDAAINPGNSGGALVTMDGKLVGINTAIYSRDGGNMGIGFAVPSNMVRAVLASVANGGKQIARPWTGINGQAVTADVAKSLGLSRPVGLLVNAIHSASPALKAGLKIGDVIVAVNGKPVDDPAAFAYRIATLSSGTSVELELMRGGKNMKISFALIVPPETPAPDETLIKEQSPLKGATLANLSPAICQAYDLRQAEKGVVLVKIDEGSVAARLGFEKGDLILQVNEAKIESVQDVVSALKSRSARGWRLVIDRKDQRVNLFFGD